MFPFASCIYKNNVFFGGYPNQEWIECLLSNSTKFIVDLTNTFEKEKNDLYDYQHHLESYSCTYIHFPISDNQIPENIQEFKSMINNLVIKIQQLSNEDKMYIHCKGGHGRSGLVSACLLCPLLNVYPENALDITTLAHSNREFLKPKWKNVKCPQTFRQRKFVIDLYKPVQITPEIYYDKISNNLLSFLEEVKTRPIIHENNKKDRITEVILHLRKIHSSSENIIQFPAI